MLWYTVRYGDMKCTYLFTYKNKILDAYDMQEKCIIRNFFNGIKFSMVVV